MLFEISWGPNGLQMSLWPEFILFFIVPLFFIIEISLVKLALKLAKAQTRKGFKWVILSVLIQLGLFAFVSMPFMFFGFMGMMDEMSVMAPFIVMLVFLAMFLDVCMINVIHKIGLKRATGVFIFLLIGVFIVVGVAGGMISATYAQYYNPSGGMTLP